MLPHITLIRVAPTSVGQNLSAKSLNHFLRNDDFLIYITKLMKSAFETQIYIYRSLWRHTVGGEQAASGSSR